MLTPFVRLLLILIAVAVGAIYAFRGESLGWLLLAAAGLLAVGYWRHATVWLAFQAYRRGDVDGVERHLRVVRDADRLSSADRAYFDFLRGVLAQARGDLEEARRSFTAAAAGPLRTGNMRSGVQYHLAAISLERGDKNAARSHLDEARRWPHNSHVAERLATIEQQLTSS